MANESKLVWAPLKRALDKTMPAAHLGWAYDRIENRAGIGITDTNIHVPGHGDVWIELKYATFTDQKAQTLRVGLEPAQYVWMRNAARKGRRVLLLARISDAKECKALRGNYWRIWEEEKDWEIAKHPAPTYQLLATSQGFPSPEALLLWLSGWGTIGRGR